MNGNKFSSALRHRIFRAVVAYLIIALSACASEPNTQRVSRDDYEKAKAIFAERCKSAGVVVHKIAKDVDGIELLKVRPILASGDKRYFDPMFDGAAMAAEYQGDSYIASFLYSEFRDPLKPGLRQSIVPPEMESLVRKWTANDVEHVRGYAFVDVPDLVDGRVWRYRVVPGLSWSDYSRRGGWVKNLQRELRTGAAARYAVDYVDIVDPADRKYWIAGTRVTVIDRQTGEVMGELTRYVWDSGFGVSTTGRLPWQHVTMRGSEVCPRVQIYPHVTRYFVDTVLIPQQGEK